MPQGIEILFCSVVATHCSSSAALNISMPTGMWPDVEAGSAHLDALVLEVLLGRADEDLILDVHGKAANLNLGWCYLRLLSWSDKPS